MLDIIWRACGIGLIIYVSPHLQMMRTLIFEFTTETFA